MPIFIKLFINKALQANFFLAAAMVIWVGFTSLDDSLSAFDFNSEYPGALDNSLRIMMVYLAVTEAIVLAYCCVSQNFRSTFFVGIFLLLVVGSLAFYGEANDVVIDDNLPLFFLYTGISHSVYGLLVILASKLS